MWRVFIIHVLLWAFADASCKTWMNEDTPHLFLRRGCGGMVRGERMMEMQEFHCDREKMDRDIATINDLLQKSKKWTGGELRHSEEHYRCQEYKDWEAECTEFLLQFNANTKLWNDEVVLKSTCAKIIVLELNRLLVEIPQEVYKLRYWRLEDQARYSL